MFSESLTFFVIQQVPSIFRVTGEHSTQSTGLNYEYRWGCVHTTGASRSQTSNMAPERLAERVWWTKSQSSLLSRLALNPIGLNPLGRLMKFAHPSIPYRFDFEHWTIVIKVKQQYGLGLSTENTD